MCIICLFQDQQGLLRISVWQTWWYRPHRCDNYKISEARLSGVQWEKIHSDKSTIDLLRQFLWLIRWENLQDHAVETISTIDLWRQFLRLIRSDNFYDQSAETISTMRRMMTSESSPQVAKCSIEQYLILIKCLYCKIAIIKIDIFCWICFH